MTGADLTRRIERLKEIASAPKMPRLNLRIKNGNSAFYDKVLEITPLGLEGGLRQALDGYVFLGTLKHSMPDERGRFQVVNDFILPPFQLPNQVKDPKSLMQSGRTSLNQSYN